MHLFLILIVLFTAQSLLFAKSSLDSLEITRSTDQARPPRVPDESDVSEEFLGEAKKLNTIVNRLTSNKNALEKALAEIERTGAVSDGSGISDPEKERDYCERNLRYLKQKLGKLKEDVRIELGEESFVLLVDYHFRKMERVLEGERVPDRLLKPSPHPMIPPQEMSPLFRPDEVEVVAKLDYPAGHVAVAEGDNGRPRVFLNAGFYYPEELLGDEDPVQVIELITEDNDAGGTPVTTKVPFPHPRYQKKFQSTHSVKVDSKKWLWILDYGRLRFLGGVPKIMAYKLDAKEDEQEVLSYELPIDIAPQGSFLNDMVIIRNENGGTILIDDTSALANKPALIVLQFDQGQNRRYEMKNARRLLEGHYSMSPYKGYMHYYRDHKDLEQEKVWKAGIYLDTAIYSMMKDLGLHQHARLLNAFLGNIETFKDLRNTGGSKPSFLAKFLGLFKRNNFLPLQIGVDGITLDRENDVVYYGPANRGELYRINLADLLNERLEKDGLLAKRVERFTEMTTTDGITIDNKRNVYVTDQEHDAIVKVDSHGRIEPIVRGKEFAWPVSIAFGPQGYLYFTCYSLPDVTSRVPSVIKNLGPYYVYRINLRSKLGNDIAGTVGH